MDKKIYVKDIKGEGIEVNDFFVVQKKALYLGRNNAHYLSLVLKDKTGTIEAKIWERVEELANLFQKNDVIFVRSKSKVAERGHQLYIYELRKIEDVSIEEMKFFYGEARKENSLLREEFFNLTKEIKNPFLFALFQVFLRDEKEKEKFFLYPASLNLHHAYIGGLLEHSVTLAKIGKIVAEIKGADKDIVVAGSLLHDIGKIDEIELRGGFRFSDKGRLLGHISLGLLKLKELTNAIDNFPALLEDVLAHIILSHHGLEEWGSPKRPMFIEALIVHYLDNLDARVEGVRGLLEDQMEDERWSFYHKVYESRFMNLSGVDIWK